MDDITAHNEPHIVNVKDFRIDADYAAWLSEIKRRYISAQIKASIMWPMKQWYLRLHTTEAYEKLSRLVADLQKIESPYLIKLPHSVTVLNGEPCFPIVPEYA